MMRYIINILAFLALALLITHQIVPHCHCLSNNGIETCAQEVEEEQSIWDKIFGVDIGDHHLENYTTSISQNNPTQAIFLYVNFVAPVQYTILAKVQLVDYIDQVPISVQLQSYLTSITLRPPPAI